MSLISPPPPFKLKKNPFPALRDVKKKSRRTEANKTNFCATATLHFIFFIFIWYCRNVLTVIHRLPIPKKLWCAIPGFGGAEGSDKGWNKRPQRNKAKPTMTLCTRNSVDELCNQNGNKLWVFGSDRSISSFGSLSKMNVKIITKFENKNKRGRIKYVAFGLITKSEPYSKSMTSKDIGTSANSIFRVSPEIAIFTCATKRKRTKMRMAAAVLCFLLFYPLIAMTTGCWVKTQRPIP